MNKSLLNIHETDIVTKLSDQIKKLSRGLEPIEKKKRNEQTLKK